MSAVPNHGFLYGGTDGWQLAPAYDLHPVPVDNKPRILTTAIDLDDGTASVDLAMNVAAYLELKEDEAQEIISEVENAVAGWRHVATELGLEAGQIDRVASAFEH